MNEIKEELTQKQLMAIPILLSDPCIEKACKKANISKVSFYKWLNDETFRREYEKQRDSIIDNSITKLKTCFSLAIDELYNLLTSKNENIRIRAAEKIIEFNIEIAEVKALENRIQALEESTNAK